MRKITIFILLLLSICLYAEQLDDIYAGVLDYYSRVKTFEANLFQENYWLEIDTQKSSSGKLYFNNDSLYINYSEPDEQQLYVLNNTVIMHDKHSNQAIYMDKSDFDIKPVDVITSYWQTGSKRLIQAENDEVVIAITKDDQKLQVILRKNLIIKITITDDNGNRVSYQFTDQKINKPLPQRIFTPDFPANTNIIDNRNHGE